MSSSNGEFIISIDQGTTGNRVFCFDRKGRVIASSYEEFAQHYPRPGWVEHNPEEIYNQVISLIGRTIDEGNLDPTKATGIGITNQRETTIVWERSTGKPVYNAIVWQCRRTADTCQELKRKGYEPLIREKTGLVIDAYFSATKIKWILENVEGARKRADSGELCAGTMDSYILYRLTGAFATEHTNASRTMLYNIHDKKWDSELLSVFNIPDDLLPDIKNSMDNFGKTKNVPRLPDGIPVYAMAGDQQAALFGQLCTKPGEGKNTYGTGAFLLFHTGDEAVQSSSGLLTTLAIDESGKPAYALEGSIFIAGAVVQWLRDYMRFFAEAGDTEEIIRSIEDEEDDVSMVPAFAGLGAPHWDMNARGAIFGITRDTTPARIIRAAIKSVGLQSLDLVMAMERDTGRKMDFLKVDGGMATNSYLLQYQSDILGIPVIRPSNVDTTALGVAYLAGMKVGLWSSLADLEALESEKREFHPQMSPDRKEREIVRWHSAINRVKGWLDD